MPINPVSSGQLHNAYWSQSVRNIYISGAHSIVFICHRQLPGKTFQAGSKHDAFITSMRSFNAMGDAYERAVYEYGLS